MSNYGPYHDVFVVGLQSWIFSPTEIKKKIKDDSKQCTSVSDICFLENIAIGDLLKIKKIDNWIKKKK